MMALVIEKLLVLLVCSKLVYRFRKLFKRLLLCEILVVANSAVNSFLCVNDY